MNSKYFSSQDTLMVCIPNTLPGLLIMQRPFDRINNSAMWSRGKFFNQILT